MLALWGDFLMSCHLTSRFNNTFFVSVGFSFPLLWGWDIFISSQGFLLLTVFRFFSLQTSCVEIINPALSLWHHFWAQRFKENRLALITGPHPQLWWHHKISAIFFVALTNSWGGKTSRHALSCPCGPAGWLVLRAKLWQCVTLCPLPSPPTPSRQTCTDDRWPMMKAPGQEIKKHRARKKYIERERREKTGGYCY